MGVFKAALKAVKGDMFGAASEFLPDSIKDQGKEVMQETAADFLETRDVKGVGKRLVDNALSRVAGKGPGQQNAACDEQLSFLVSVDGQEAGPFTIAELQQFVATGEFHPQVYVWTEGMPQWELACDVPELANLFSY